MSNFGISIAEKMEGGQRQRNRMASIALHRYLFCDALFTVIRYSGYDERVIEWAKEISHHSKNPAFRTWIYQSTNRLRLFV